MAASFISNQACDFALWHIASIRVYDLNGRYWTKDGVIGRPACRSLVNVGAALQADGGTRSAFAASSIRRRSAAWTILPD